MQTSLVHGLTSTMFVVSFICRPSSHSQRESFPCYLSNNYESLSVNGSHILMSVVLVLAAAVILSGYVKT